MGSPRALRDNNGTEKNLKALGGICEFHLSYFYRLLLIVIKSTRDCLSSRQTMQNIVMATHQESINTPYSMV